MRELKSGYLWEEISETYRKELCELAPARKGFINIGREYKHDEVHIACFKKEMRGALVVVGDWPILTGRDDSDYMDHFVYIGNCKTYVFKDIEDFDVLENVGPWCLQQCREGHPENVLKYTGGTVTTADLGTFYLEYCQIASFWYDNGLEEWFK